MRKIELSRLSDLKPDYYESVVDMDILQSVQQLVIDEVAETFDEVLQNIFLKLADKEGLTDLERIYQITPMGDLEQRRYNILARLLPPQPITYSYLKNFMSGFGIKITTFLNIGNYHLDVTVEDATKSEVEFVKSIVHRYIPANLTYTIHHNHIIDNEADLREVAPMMRAATYEGGNDG